VSTLAGSKAKTTVNASAAGADESLQDGPWHIEDIVLQDCEATKVHIDDFEDQ
jgi:hypothetical protein